MNNEENPSASSQKSSNLSWILYMALAVVTAAAGYFFFRNNQHVTEKKKLEIQSVGDSIRIADLDLKYAEAQAELSSCKGLSRELDSMIAIRQAELEKCRSEFLVLVRKNRVNEAEYQKQLAAVEQIVTDHETLVTQLQSENKLLIVKVDSLGRIIIMQNNTITILNDSTAALTKKVIKGSLLKPTSITATGIRVKQNGKEPETNKASKAEQLKICLTLPSNEMASAGPKTFYIRILNPKGAVLAPQESSRLFKMAETGEERSYTMTANVTYTNASMKNCSYWRQVVPYEEGTYTVEIYQDGYLVGTQKMALK